jgi:hypothetical protein
MVPFHFFTSVHDSHSEVPEKVEIFIRISPSSLEKFCIELGENVFGCPICTKVLHGRGLSQILMSFCVNFNHKRRHIFSSTYYFMVPGSRSCKILPTVFATDKSTPLIRARAYSNKVVVFQSTFQRDSTSAEMGGSD